MFDSTVVAFNPQVPEHLRQVAQPLRGGEVLWAGVWPLQQSGDLGQTGQRWAGQQPAGLVSIDAAGRNGFTQALNPQLRVCEGGGPMRLTTALAGVLNPTTVHVEKAHPRPDFIAQVKNRLTRLPAGPHLLGQYAGFPFVADQPEQQSPRLIRVGMAVIGCSRWQVADDVAGLGRKLAVLMPRYALPPLLKNAPAPSATAM